MTRLYLDVTRTIADGVHTGIQRVVRRIAADAVRIGPVSGLTIVPVVTDGTRYYRLDASGLAELASRRSSRPGAIPHRSFRSRATS